MLETKRVNVKGKDFLLIGELHIYSAEDSKQAESLLDAKNPDIIFAEGVDLKHFRLLQEFVYEAAAFLSRRKYPCLIATARKQGRRIVHLEKGYDLPSLRKTSFVLILLAIVAFVSLVLLHVFVPPVRVYTEGIVRIVNNVVVFIIGVLLLLEFLLAHIKGRQSLLVRMVGFSVDKNRRDYRMVKTLCESITTLSFKKAFVVVGKFHLNHIEELLSKG